MVIKTVHIFILCPYILIASHHENWPKHYTEFLAFKLKRIFFYAPNIDCGYTLEPLVILMKTVCIDIDERLKSFK